MKFPLKMTILFTSIFGVATATTTFVSRQMDINNYNNSENADIDFDNSNDLPDREFTDNEKFINSLTTMGNLSGDLNLTATYQEYNIGLNATINVGMEDIEKLSLSGSGQLSINDIRLDLSFTYMNNYVYLDILNNHIKFPTEKFGDVIEILNSFDIPIDLPEEIKNLDSNQLLVNLGNMKITKGNTNITYEFSLFENAAPIVFTSDLDYKLNKIKVHNFSLMGIVVNASANVTVHGVGKNLVNTPKEESYVDGSIYLGALNKIKSIFEKKLINTNYDIDILRNNETIFNSTGEINFDFANYLFAANGDINVNDNKTTYGLYYNNESVYLNYDNSLKIGYSKESMNGLVDIVKKYQEASPLSLLFDKFETVEIPLINSIKNKDYLSLYDYFDSVVFSGNGISLYLSNEMLTESKEIIHIELTNNEGIHSVAINNLVLGDYTFNLNLTLKEEENISLPDFAQYEMLDGFNNIFDEALALCQETKFALDLAGNITTSKGNISFSGETQFDLESKNGSGKIRILDDNSMNHDVQIDIYENNEMFFSYNNRMKGYFNLDTVREVIELIKSLINSDDPRFSQYVVMLEDSLLGETIKKVKEGKYEALIVSGLIEDIKFNGEDLHIVIPGKLIGAESPLSLQIDMNNGELQGIYVNGAFGDNEIELTLRLKGYSNNWSLLDISNRSVYTDYSEIKVLLEDILKTAELDYFNIKGTLDLTAIGIFNWSLPLKCQLKIEEDERVRGYIEISEIPNLSHLISGKKRTSKIYIDGNDDVYIWTKGPRNSIFDGGIYTTELKVTSAEFKKNILYYMCNVILGLSESITDSFDTAKETKIDISKVLKSYSFVNGSEPTWKITLDMKELAGSEAMNDLNATIKANSNHYMNSIDASISIGSSIFSLDIDLSASLINIGSSFDFTYFYTYMNNNKSRAYSYH